MTTNRLFFNNSCHQHPSSMKKPDKDSIFSEIEALDMDAWHFNEHGSIRSGDIPDRGALFRLQIAMELAKSIKKAKGIAFNIDRNFNGIDIQPVGNTAERFYNFVRTVPFSAPVHHAIPPEISILENVAQEICPQGYSFTSNPGLLIPNTTILEADLINSWCKRTFTKLSTKGSTVQSARFTADTEKNIRKIAKIFREIKQQTSRTFCLRFDLTLPNQQGKPSLQGQIFLNLATKFLDMLREGSSMDTPLALVSKFEVLPDIGNRLHVSAIWNAALDFSPNFVRETIKEAWAQICDGRGSNYFYGFNLPNYRGWGVGFDQIEILEAALINLFRRDFLLKLVPQKTFSTIVFREISKPAQL